MKELLLILVALGFLCAAVEIFTLFQLIYLFL
ncbi:hypothetical protein L280_05115 [Mannheimia haemolytica MhBrain2012]|uniref:Uncharacterized protein n=1 Tax=Mannheimia haemolytica TaxID=75985 RepID=A0A378MSH0_MANHA|nr:hypothetical protein F382_06305 [Mannheimia haemolytica D153]AGQ38508.1 hypothetical protein J450_05005 [Mannheimia haemolytica D171]AGQ41151.1 hypothetical protein J451_06540 [Mannheimia haemolytica D174]AGR76071.1 hypothetical protein N220_12460 [Mannheimia haemolytica USMARC_2286]EPZ00458.1 hypothetical protein L278_06410 [Mannheimia haemolytica D35]EPZ02872.1 hypothetical protein L279_01300 [Mannheimia haemolytica D38]EPZ22913.1 hypothetical protein L277_06470 [Mannheimia haemolytica D